MNTIKSVYKLPKLLFARPVALSGRVYCYVDTSSGNIEVGDLLTTSANKGHAMKVTDYTKVQGAILGKAIEAFSGDTGLILVLVTLQLVWAITCAVSGLSFGYAQLPG